MGRHSASYLAARDGRPTSSPSTGAARYVGRVGALAVAMGVGAAVVAGAGVANAEDGPDKAAADPGGAPAAAGPAAADDTTTGDTLTDSGAKTGPSVGTHTRKPGFPNVPKMALGSGRGPAEHAGQRPGQRADEQTSETAGPEARPDFRPGSLPRAISRLPERLADFVNDVADAANAAAEPAGAPEPPAPTRDGTRPDGVSRVPSRARDLATVAAVTGTVDKVVTTSRSGGASLGVPTTAIASGGQQIADAVPASPPVSLSSPSSARLAVPAAWAAPTPPRPVATLVATFLSAAGINPTLNPGGAPPRPGELLLGALQLIRRELERTGIDQAFGGAPRAVLVLTQLELERRIALHTNPGPTPTVPAPTPGDAIATEYGDIGKWMLKSDGQIANWGGVPHDDRTLLEPVNIIVVDSTSTTPEESTAKLNSAMFWSGFPGQPIHSTGFQGKIGDVIYGQQPDGVAQAYSDLLFLLPNDHGRMFGPAPIENGTGYVWTGSFSTEALGIYNGEIGHQYVSSNVARDVLILRMLLSGQATFVGVVPMENAVDSDTQTTGDHDGYAVVVALR